MKKSTRKLAVNFLLIILIAVILWIGYIWFIGGPARLYDDQDSQYILQFIEQENYEEAQMVSRFSFDSVYYIIEATKDGKTELAWFTHTFDKKGTHALVDQTLVFPLADNYGVDHSDISLGVYNDKLVYVLRKKNMFEMYISVDSLEVVFQVGGVS